MKRLLSMALVLFMMAGMTAAAQPSAVLQDEQPPKAVTYVNAAGEAIIAKICGPDGNVIAEIRDDGTLLLTDVHDRENAANGVIVTRLTNAYNDVMDDVHYGDVECKLHDHSVKVDIDTILASVDQEITSHDLVMYELFDIMLPEETAALLAEGNYLELTFELTEAHQDQPLIVMQTDDGAGWKVIPVTEAGEKQFTVRMTELGTLALMCDGREYMGVGQDVQRVVIVVPGTEGGEYYVEQDNFTPSVSGKSAPKLVRFEGEDGMIYIGYIRNGGGDIEIKVPDRNYIIVTAVSERDHIVDIQTHEHLEWSYDKIMEAEDVGELFGEHDPEAVIADHAHGTIAGQLDKTLAEMGLDLTHEKLVVKDLFEVSAYGDYLQNLYAEDYYLEVTFDADLEPGEPLVVIHSFDSRHWHVHEPADIRMNADGTVTLRLHDLGAVAFLVEGKEEVDAQTAVQSPN